MFSGRADLAIQVQGAIKIQEAEFRHSRRQSGNAVMVHFSNEEREFSFRTYSFGSHVFNVRIGSPRAEEVRITAISITDENGEVHEFPYEQFQHKMNYITTSE